MPMPHTIKPPDHHCHNKMHIPLTKTLILLYWLYQAFDTNDPDKIASGAS